MGCKRTQVEARHTDKQLDSDVTIRYTSSGPVERRESLTQSINQESIKQHNQLPNWIQNKYSQHVVMLMYLFNRLQVTDLFRVFFLVERRADSMLKFVKYNLKEAIL